MKKTHGSDHVLTLLALVTTVIGLFAIWDAGYARSAVAGGIVPREFQSQFSFAVVSIFLGILVSRLPHRTLEQFAKWGLGLALIGLVLVEVPGLGKEIGGARRWLDFRIFTVQPAEFAKLAVIFFLAGYLAHRKPLVKKPVRDVAEQLDRNVIPFLARVLPLVWIGVVIYLIEREPDLATAMVIAVTTFFMLIVAGVRWQSLAALVAIGATFIGIMVVKEPYRLDRIVNHATRWSSDNVDGMGYQTTQSETALARGGLFGVGLGNGRAKHVLPAPTTDFILGTIGEEFGLVGSLVVVCLLATMTYRLMAAGWRRKDPFGRMVLIGTGVWIAIQTATNILMANGAWPPIGVPLPFISAGGSSLVALWVSLGFCQAVLSREVPTEEEANETGRHGWRNRRARISRA